MDTINQLATSLPWELLIAGGLLSPLASVVIRLFKAQKDVVKLGIVFAVGLAMSAAAYLSQNPEVAPGIIFRNAALLTLTAQPWYYLVVKPGIVWLGQKVTQEVMLDEDIKSALEPTGGLTPVAQTIEVQTFNK